MKNFHIFSIALIVLFISAGSVKAQENDREIKIRVVKEVNGERTVLDTTIVVSDVSDPDDFKEAKAILDANGLEEIAINLAELKKGYPDIEVEVTATEGKENELEKVIIITRKDQKESDEGDETVITLVETDSQAGENTMILKMGEGSYTYVIADGEGNYEVKPDSVEKTVIMFRSDDGKETRIVSGGENMVWVGDDVIHVKTRILLEQVNEEDAKSLEKSGVSIKPEESKMLELENLKFYPNPSDGKFRLEFTSPEKEPVSIAVYDVMGGKIYEDKITDFNGSYNREIDISSEKKGTCFLKITQGAKMYSRKIVLE